MADIEECRTALDGLSARLVALPKPLPERTVSCEITDLDVIFHAQLGAGGLTDITTEPAPQAKVRLRLSSDDLLALVAGELNAGSAFASGRLHLGRIAFRDRHTYPIVTPIAIGALLAGVFVAGAVLVRSVPLLAPLEDQVVSVVDYADQGSLPLLAVITAVNGVAEELFFRGAAYAAITVHPVLWTTVAYAVATLASRHPLVIAHC